jgi:tRNA-2-methylthio-N6-dimethylallyladenosine synthase
MAVNSEARVEGQETAPNSNLSELKYFIQTYGCQMNTADSEIVASILEQAGMQSTPNLEDSDLVLLNTCAIRENAESKVWNRLDFINSINKDKSKIVGVLGCMAERLKEKLVDRSKVVDLVVGPDAYRDLPNLVSNLLVRELWLL